MKTKLFIVTAALFATTFASAQTEGQIFFEPTISLQGQGSETTIQTPDTSYTSQFGSRVIGLNPGFVVAENTVVGVLLGFGGSNWSPDDTVTYKMRSTAFGVFGRRYFDVGEGNTRAFVQANLSFGGENNETEFDNLGVIEDSLQISNTSFSVQAGFAFPLGENLHFTTSLDVLNLSATKTVDEFNATKDNEVKDTNSAFLLNDGSYFFDNITFALTFFFGN